MTTLSQTNKSEVTLKTISVFSTLTCKLLKTSCLLCITKLRLTQSLMNKNNRVADATVSKPLFISVVSFFVLLLPAHIITTLHKILEPLNFQCFLSVVAISLLYL